MKGYYTAFGYMGWLPLIKMYLLFATEKEYADIYKFYS